MNDFPPCRRPGSLAILLLYLLLLPKVTPAQIGNIKGIRPYKTAHALVVGVSDYAHEDIRDLRFADDDATAFSRLLTEETAWRIDPANVVLLTNAEATFERFMAELTAITDRSQPRDRVILYFAGHGDVEVVSDRKTGFLLFHNATPAAYAIGGACEVNTLDDALNKLVLEKETEVILIADACRSGSLVGNLAGTRTGGQAATAAVIEELFRGTIKIMSCQPGESSLEDPDLGGGRGLFSYYLGQGLTGAADRNQDRYVNLLELDNYLRSEVYAASRERQIPDAAGPMSRQLTKVSRAAAPAAQPALTRSDGTLNPAPTRSDGTLNPAPTRSDGTLNPAPAYAPAETVTRNNAPTTARDTPLVQKLMAFNEAIARKDLLYPRENNAYRLYRSMGDSPEAEAFKTIMKTSLTAALQEEPQKALNDYVDSPSRELGRRWTNAAVYARYPDYLDVAATIMGTENSFYPTVRSRAHYFRGVNLRLAADAAREGRGKDSLYRAAMAEQERALTLVDADKAPHILNEQGVIALRTKALEAAIARLRQAYELSPRWAVVVNNLAIAYHGQQDYGRAEELYRQAIELDAELSLPYYNLGLVLQEQGRYEQAIDNYRIATTKADPYPDAFYNLGNIYFSQPDFIDYPASAANLEALIVLKPNDVYAMLFLSDVYLKMEREEKAEALLAKARTILPDDYYLLSASGDLAMLKGDYPAAIRFYQKSSELQPDRASAKIYLAGSYAADGQADQALQILEGLFAAGFTELTKIEEEESFAPLRSSVAYRALVAKYFPGRE